MNDDFNPAELNDRLQHAMEEGALLSWLFSLGDSTDGPIGYCMRVVASTPEGAVQKAREAVRQTGTGTRYGCDEHSHPDVEYLNTYLNAEAIGKGDIDLSETEIA
jgi:hypothetical protein